MATFPPICDRDREMEIRDYRPGDQPAAYFVCLKTGNHGKDGEPFFAEDPDALGRIYVGPYLAFEPELALLLEDSAGVAGYALGAFDSRAFYDRYERQWRPKLCEEYSSPTGNPATWSRVEVVYHHYHHPDYFCPEPYESYPSHLHIDLLPRVQRQGFGRKMMEQLMMRLRSRGSPGVHLGLSPHNKDAFNFYKALGFVELVRHPTGEDETIYMGKRLVE